MMSEVFILFSLLVDPQHLERYLADCKSYGTGLERVPIGKYDIVNI